MTANPQLGRQRGSALRQSAKSMQRSRKSSAGLESRNGGFGGLRATRVPRRGRKSSAGLEGYSNGGGS